MPQVDIHLLPVQIRRRRQLLLQQESLGNSVDCCHAMAPQHSTIANHTPNQGCPASIHPAAREASMPSG